MTVVHARDMCESFLLILVLPVPIYCFNYRNLTPYLTCVALHITQYLYLAHH